MGKVRALRVDDATWGRWESEARDRGVSISEFIRGRVDRDDASAIGRPSARSSAKTAKASGPARRVTMCEHRRGPEQFCPRCDA